MFLKTFAEFLLRRNLQHMIVHVTNHCNFRCEHCFIDFSPKRDIPLTDYQRLGREVGPLFWLDIGGGEPFLRKDLPEIIGSFDAKVIQIPTNGSLKEQIVAQTQKMRNQLKADIAVSLSLDGLKERHEKIRKASGNWEQVWDTFEALRKIDGVRVKINTVLSRENAGEILDLMKEVRGRQPDFHSIILLRGDPANPEYGLPSLDELRELAPRIFDILGTYDYGKGWPAAHILRNYHRYLWNVSLQTIEQKTQVVPCLAGQAHMILMGNGDVSSCEMLPPVGNIREQSWQAIMDSEELRQQKEDIVNKKCYCTHNCAMLDSILFRPASLPHLLDEKV